MQRFLAEKRGCQAWHRRRSGAAVSGVEKTLGRGCRKGSQGEKRARRRRSQAGIIFISDFVMKIKLHENR
jgi:hypothetical protein